MIQHNLNEGNYFSPENKLKYTGSSEFKNSMSCEAAALAEIRGEYRGEETTALLVGSYVDAHFEGTLDIFRAQHPEIISSQGKTAGQLKSEYKKAETTINRMEQDELFMMLMSGKKQVIMVGEIDGVSVKIKVDSLVDAEICRKIAIKFPQTAELLGDCNGIIVDEKAMKDFKSIWVPDKGKVHWIEGWGYDFQGAIYQEIVRQNLNCLLPFVLAAGTKEDIPDVGSFFIPQTLLDYCLDIVKQNIVRFDAIKKGIIEPERCERCDWCKRTKILSEIIDYTEEAI